MCAMFEWPPLEAVALATDKPQIPMWPGCTSKRSYPEVTVGLATPDVLGTLQTGTEQPRVLLSGKSTLAGLTCERFYSTEVIKRANAQRNPPGKASTFHRSRFGRSPTADPTLHRNWAVIISSRGRARSLPATNSRSELVKRCTV